MLHHVASFFTMLHHVATCWIRFVGLGRIGGFCGLIGLGGLCGLVGLGLLSLQWIMEDITESEKVTD